MSTFNTLLLVLISAVLACKMSIIDYNSSTPADPAQLDCISYNDKTLFRTPRAFSVYTYVDYTIHIPRHGCVAQRLVLLYLSSLLLSLSYAPEPNPGPIAGPISSVLSNSSSTWQCGTCDLTVGWDDKGLACNTCGLWYHARCQSIDSLLYQQHDQLGDEVPWYCAICGNPNSTTIFDFHGVGQTSISSSSSMSILDSCTTPTKSDMPKPLHRSTPTRASQQEKWKKRPLRLLNINLQSSSGKRAEISNLLDSLKPDIVVATETWLDSSIQNAEIFPDSFKVFRKDRHRHGGGVLVAVHSQFDCSEVREFQEDNCELIWVRLKLPGRKHLYVCSYYRPDVADEASFNAFNASLTKATSISNAHLIVAGDLNFPSWDWNEMKMKPNATYPRLHNTFIDALNDLGMEQMVKDPTRGQNTLDLVITNNPQQIPRVEVLPGLSDHDAVFCEINIHPQKRRQNPRRVPIYRNADWGSMKDEMNELYKDIRSMANPTTEELWSSFRNKLQAAVEKYIPHKQTKPKDSKPWITPALRRLMKKRDRMFKKMRKQGCVEYEEQYKDLRREVQRQTRRLYWSYLNDIFEEADSSSSSTSASTPDQAIKHKRFWAYMKHQKSSRVGVAPLRKDGRLSAIPREQANILNQQFLKAFSEGRTYTADEFSKKCNLPPVDHPIIDNVTISVQGVQKLLRGLQPGKAPGPDNISPRVLKELSDEIAPILTTIYQSSIQSGEVPSDWKEANVTPIFKKGEHYEPANYRPVSLTSVCCKVMEHILTSTIMTHLENNDILCHQQHGFRKRRSCETQLLGFTDELMNSMVQGKQTDILIMDFAKAFDKVNHSLLIHKLQYYGIRGILKNWVSQFLSNRRQAVVVNGARSDFINVRSGVPQGSVLGPCLFLIYINDLPDQLSSHVRLFADDTAAYNVVSSTADQQHLQQNLDLLADWERRWDMSFHPGKCVVLPVARKRKILEPKYHLHGHTLNTVNNVKYLGITLTSDLTWADHISNVCAKANKTLGFIRRNLKISSRKVKQAAYKSYVRPLLEYCSSVWDPHTQESIGKLEAIQRRAARYVMRRYHNTSSVSEMLDELQWPKLEDRRRTARLSMMYKIHHNLACAQNIRDQLQYLPARQRRGHDEQFTLPYSKTQYLQDSFLRTTIKQWNSLPQETIEASTHDAFVAMVSRVEE